MLIVDAINCLIKQNVDELYGMKNQFNFSEYQQLFVNSNIMLAMQRKITHLPIHQIIFISGRSFYPTCVNLWSVWYRKEKQILTTFATGVIIFKIILENHSFTFQSVVMQIVYTTITVTYD